MKLTGKCEEEFNKWFLKQPIAFRFNPLHFFYEDLNDSMKYGVYVDFFNSNSIYPNLSNESYMDGVNTLWQVFEYDGLEWTNNSTGLYGDNGDYTLTQARAKAVEYADRIYNKRNN